MASWIKLKGKHCKSYNALRQMKDWSDDSLKANNLGVDDMFFALMVEKELSDFVKRTGLPRDQVTIIVNRKSDNAYVQWLYAAGQKLPSEVPPNDLCGTVTALP